MTRTLRHAKKRQKHQNSSFRSFLRIYIYIYIQDQVWTRGGEDASASSHRALFNDPVLKTRHQYLVQKACEIPMTFFAYLFRFEV